MENEKAMKNNLTDSVAFAMKLFYDTPENGGLDIDELEAIFGYCDTPTILQHYSTDEIVSLIYQYLLRSDSESEDDCDEEEYMDDCSGCCERCKVPASATIYEIPEGRWRFSHAVNGDGSRRALMIGVSDTDAPQRGVGVDLPEDENIIPAFGFVINDETTAFVLISAIVEHMRWKRKEEKKASEAEEENGVG